MTLRNFHRIPGQRWRGVLFVILAEDTQRSNAKIQCHFWFSPPQTLEEFEKKICKTFVGKCYKFKVVHAGNL